MPEQAGLLKFGSVSSVESPRVCVLFADLDGMVSAPLQVIFARTIGDRHFDLPKVGEPVACLMDVNMEFGVVIGCVYTDANAPPSSDVNKVVREFEDGGKIEYDRSNGKYTLKAIGDVSIDAGGKVEIIAAESITLKAPAITLDAPMTTITGALSSGGAGGNATFGGSVQASGDVKAGSISLQQHTHGGVLTGGSSTGLPK
ncbi:phage baseplate assembly protein V [uncultured Deefgea sp.]|uniref:phage baseplate assembly protein V n=1 Tax=uncultured Deefgea sp. TaxID=1304914 RepID=UPI00262F4EBB|nr:phage baseplate assembly protein V [uncultured Deefgea sp.]